MKIFDWVDQKTGIRLSPKAMLYVAVMATIYYVGFATIGWWVLAVHMVIGTGCSVLSWANLDSPHFPTVGIKVGISVIWAIIWPWHWYQMFTD